MFALVRSLSPREKQHFKREAKTHRSTAGYVGLFDAIAKGENKTDTALQEALKSRFGADKLALRKQYLFDALSRSLLGIRSGGSLVDRVQFSIRQADLLFERGVHQQAMKTARKAETLALNAHRFDLVWQALNVQRLVLAAHKGKLFRSTRMSEVLDRMEEALERQKDLQRALRIYNRAFDRTWRNTDGAGKEAAEKLRADLESARYRELPESPNAMAQVFACSAWSQYHHAEKDYRQSEDYLRRVQVLFDREPGLLEGLPALGITVSHNLANRAILNLEWDQVPKAVERIRNIPCSNARLLTKRYTGLVGLGVHYAAMTGQDLEATAWAEILQDWDTMLPKIGTHFRLDAELKRGLYDWCLGRPGEAAERLHRLLGEAMLARMPVQECMAHAAFLLAHLDLNNAGLAGDMAAARLRKQRKKPSPFAFEPLLLELVQALGQNPLAGQRQKLLREAAKALLKARASSDYRLYLPLDSWMAARQQGTAYAAQLAADTAGLPRIPGA